MFFYRALATPLSSTGFASREALPVPSRPEPAGTLLFDDLFAFTVMLLPVAQEIVRLPPYRHAIRHGDA